MGVRVGGRFATAQRASRMTDADGFRAGAGRTSIEPPLGPPMLGFVRRFEPASSYGLPLEVTALALERGGTRVILVGVDTALIAAPEVDQLRHRIGAETGAQPAGILLNRNHTHNAPPGSPSVVINGGIAAIDEFDAPTLAYMESLQGKIASAARLACDSLEPARVVWGVGTLDENVNRREETGEGKVTLGWDPDGLVDSQITVLQTRRPDESAICTVVGYGCHSVTLGPDTSFYSADYPGPLRDAIRAWTGGEAVFLQAAGGNVLPRVAFGTTEAEAVRLGRALALEALHAVEGRAAWPREIVRGSDSSEMAYAIYRFAPSAGPLPELSAVEERCELPLQPIPSAEEISAVRADLEATLERAQAAGAGQGELNRTLFHLKWARRLEPQIIGGGAAVSTSGPVHAFRIGDGAIVTSPGEAFTEIGMAVKERSPADVTLYCGYSNGAIGYLPTARAIEEGGFEAGYAYRAFGHAANFAPTASGSSSRPGSGWWRACSRSGRVPRSAGGSRAAGSPLLRSRRRTSGRRPEPHLRIEVSDRSFPPADAVIHAPRLSLTGSDARPLVMWNWVGMSLQVASMNVTVPVASQRAVVLRAGSSAGTIVAYSASASPQAPVLGAYCRPGIGNAAPGASAITSRRASIAMRTNSKPSQLARAR